MNIPRKSLERNLFAQGYTCVIGLDEVGMACLAGPVVVGAALFRPEFYSRRWRALEYLRDSKLLQPHQRERYARVLGANRYIRHAFAIVHPREVDRLNVYHASLTGMRRALRRLGLTKRDRPYVLVDGRGRIPGITWPQQAIVKGDRKIFAIAAASVLAKTFRDGMMVRYAEKFPEYGFEIHKGYPTLRHREALVKSGPCRLHRRSFALLK